MLNSSSKFAIALILAATPITAYAGSDAKLKPAAETEIEASVETEDADVTLAEEAPTPALETEDGTALASNDSGDSMVATQDDNTVAKVDGQITEQGEGTILANNFIGSTIYSTSDESIGDVNNLIISTSGSVEGVVVGVGGFIGIGEKDVAVAMDELDVTRDEDGELKLVMDATVEQMEAAEEFVTASDLEAMERAQEASNRAVTEQETVDEY